MPADLTASLAIYGAILSTIAILDLIRRWITEYHDNLPKLGVEGFLTRIGENDALRVSITNIGKVPVTIISIEFQAGSSTAVLPIPIYSQYLVENGEMKPYPLPNTLEESRTISIFAHPSNFPEPDQLEFLVARDSTKRLHRSKRVPLKGQRFLPFQ